MRPRMVRGTIGLTRDYRLAAKLRGPFLHIAKGPAALIRADVVEGKGNFRQLVAPPQVSDFSAYRADGLSEDAGDISNPQPIRHHAGNLTVVFGALCTEFRERNAQSMRPSDNRVF